MDLSSPGVHGGDFTFDDLGLPPLTSPGGSGGFGGSLPHRATIGVRRGSECTDRSLFAGLVGPSPSPGLHTGRPSLAPGQSAPSPDGGYGFNALLPGISSPKARNALAQLCTPAHARNACNAGWRRHGGVG